MVWAFNWTLEQIWYVLSTNTDNHPLLSVGNFHLLSYWVCLWLLLIGRRLCMASGSATRDVHLLNSIMEVYLLSYHQLHGWVVVPQCACASSEHDFANPSPGHQLSSSEVSRTSPSLAWRSIHGGGAAIVWEGLSLLLNPASHVNFLILLSIFYGGPHSLWWSCDDPRLHLLVKPDSSLFLQRIHRSLDNTMVNIAANLQCRITIFFLLHFFIHLLKYSGIIREINVILFWWDYYSCVSFKQQQGHQIK